MDTSTLELRSLKMATLKSSGADPSPSPKDFSGLDDHLLGSG